jgi:transcriptional regulator
VAGSDVFTGTLDLLILRALQNGTHHGYAIGRWLREMSSEVLRIEEGALYPALHRLEKRGWVSAQWGETELRRQARFYRMTAKGRAALKKEQARWRAHVSAVESVLEATEG